MEAQMYRMIAAMLTCALLTSLTVVDAQDTRINDNVKTRATSCASVAQACHGLKDAALRECLDNYVGPGRDATSDVEQQGPAKDVKEQAEGEAEHDGSSQVDMTKAKKRGPVGPSKPESEEQKK
jgi:hypothetical protein